MGRNLNSTICVDFPGEVLRLRKAYLFRSPSLEGGFRSWVDWAYPPKEVRKIGRLSLSQR